MAAPRQSARKTPPLRTVKPGETAPKPKAAKKVDEAAKNGTHRELLVAMRDRIASAVASEKTSPRDLAALTKRLADIAEQIEAIDLRKADDPSERIRELEAALRAEAPEHPILGEVHEFSDDGFDENAI